MEQLVMQDYTTNSDLDTCAEWKLGHVEENFS